jgi:hypothetical protein
MDPAAGDSTRVIPDASVAGPGGVHAGVDAGVHDGVRDAGDDPDARATDAHGGGTTDDPNHPGYRTVADKIMGRDPGASASGHSGESVDSADSADSVDSVDSVDSADSTHSVDSADSAERTDRAARE